MTDSISKALDALESEASTIVVMPKSPVKRKVGCETPSMSMIVDDFTYARDNLHNAMEKSGALLESAMVAVAESGGAPRSIEVASMLLSQLGSTSKDLLNLAKLAQDLAVSTDDTEDIKEQKISITAAKLSEMLDAE